MKKLSVSDYLIYTFAFAIAIILIAQIEYGIETDYKKENNIIRKTKKHSEKLNELFNQNAEIKEAKKILKLIQTNIY